MHIKVYLVRYWQRYAHYDPQEGRIDAHRGAQVFIPANSKRQAIEVAKSGLNGSCSRFSAEHSHDVKIIGG